MLFAGTHYPQWLLLSAFYPCADHLWLDRSDAMYEAISIQVFYVLRLMAEDQKIGVSTPTL